jgi:hypothetical protein
MEHTMRIMAVFILLLVLLVGLTVPTVLADSLDRLQAACEAGEADPGLCYVAEVGGLVTPAAEVARR